MTPIRLLIAAVCVAAFLSIQSITFAMGGTSPVASKGNRASVSPDWPAGVDAVVNDRLRTSGWNSWFSEWPNDVNHYAFEIKSTDDLNQLIAKLAQIKTDLKQVRLSYLKEPVSLGWVTRLPEGNGIPVIFTIGNQVQIDKWYQHVRKPFGVMEFTAAPVAVPPTLTIFVRNEVIKLDELKIPDGIDVSMGSLPGIFHKANTTAEQIQEQMNANQKEASLEKLKATLDEPSLAAFKKIDQFLASRKKSETP